MLKVPKVIISAKHTPNCRHNQLHKFFQVQRICIWSHLFYPNQILKRHGPLPSRSNFFLLWLEKTPSLSNLWWSENHLWGSLAPPQKKTHSEGKLKKKSKIYIYLRDSASCSCLFFSPFGSPSTLTFCSWIMFLCACNAETQSFLSAGDQTSFIVPFGVGKSTTKKMGL